MVLNHRSQLDVTVSVRQMCGIRIAGECTNMGLKNFLPAALSTPRYEQECLDENRPFLATISVKGVQPTAVCSTVEQGTIFS